MVYYLAIDIGASSGRHIVGWNENGEIKTEEVYRFPNGVHEENGHLVWDIESLTQHVKQGIDIARTKYPIYSLSIDTWGVDYVLLDNDKEILPVYAYRDHRTEEIIPKVHATLPFSTLFAHTGIQFQPFNSIYQFAADLESGRLNRATDFLMIPEYLLFKLTGVKAHEYTNATTTGLVSPQTKEYDHSIVKALGFPEALFTKLSPAGTYLGDYEGIKVVLCATHDTGSAVEGIPMTDNAPYISSGTWSLLGIKSSDAHTDANSEKANYSNEGGIGYIRYQKNIMGMWLINELKRELYPDVEFNEVMHRAEQSTYDVLVNANDPLFFSPVSMKAAFDEALAQAESKPKNKDDYFRCAYRSLADGYRIAIDELESNMGQHFNELYIVGGGAKNSFLNRLTAESTHKKINALPIEATALGNLKIQMEANS